MAVSASVFSSRGPCRICAFSFFNFLFMEIRIGNRIAEVELVGREGNQVRLMIDGILHEVDVAFLKSGRCSVLFEGNSYQVDFVRGGQGKHYDLMVNQECFQVQLLDAQAKFLHARKGVEERQDERIEAPMPGKIVRIPVEEGNCLRAGDVAVVLEAMKMQSNYKVSADCRVKKVLVREGDLVQAGQVLVLLDFD